MNLQLAKDPCILWVNRKLLNELSAFSEQELKSISPNTDRAKELVLVFCSELNRSFFKKCRKEDPWISLKSIYLRDNVGASYNKLRELLIRKGVINVFEYYIPGKQSYKYEMRDEYVTSGITEYQIVNEKIRKKLLQRHEDVTAHALENPISSFLIEEVYPNIQLKSKKELLEIGQNHVKSGYSTSKGKFLKQRGHKSRLNSLKRKNVRYIEDDILLYERLTKGGFKVPTIGSTRCGGRVYDSFSLMPKWIRSSLTVNNSELVELDYSTLHPNIANHIYGNNKNTISHTDAANFLKIDKKEAKIMNMSFFNKRVKDMKACPLFEYYQSEFPSMLDEIVLIKDVYGYKKVSHDLFRIETKLMTEVINQLRALHIPAIYIYDALLVEKSNEAIVRNIMNNCAREIGLNTSV
ncbi:MAG: hypothetical protein RLP15_08305 [Cryomorphaceae bacterium]